VEPVLSTTVARATVSPLTTAWHSSCQKGMLDMVITGKYDKRIAHCVNSSR
jgi:hypothetical protein